MTFRRSNRSPRMPPSGANTPLTPNVSSNDADSQAAEPVRSYTVKFSAANAAAPPVIEIRRASASLRTALRDVLCVRIGRLLGASVGLRDGASGGPRRRDGAPHGR